MTSQPEATGLGKITGTPPKRLQVAGHILLWLSAPHPSSSNPRGVAPWEVWGPDPESGSPNAAPMLLPLAAL